MVMTNERMWDLCDARMKVEALKNNTMQYRRDGGWKNRTCRSVQVKSDDAGL